MSAILRFDYTMKSPLAFLCLQGHISPKSVPFCKPTELLFPGLKKERLYLIIYLVFVTRNSK